MDGSSRNLPKALWGFEGCGCMWNFYDDEDITRRAAQHNPIYCFSFDEALNLENTRRREMDFPQITVEQFLECINQSLVCIPPSLNCEE